MRPGAHCALNPFALEGTAHGVRNLKTKPKNNGPDVQTWSSRGGLSQKEQFFACNALAPLFFLAPRGRSYFRGLFAARGAEKTAT